MQGKNIASLNDLLKLHPRQILTWLETLDKDRYQDFNWLGLEEVSSMEAISALDEEQSLIWAQIVLYVNSLFPEDHFIALIRIINFRSALINKYTHINGDFVLDAQKLAQIVLINIPYSYREVVSKIREWNMLDIAEIYLLRTIKNMVSPLFLIKETIPEPEKKKIIKWLNLLNRLP